MIAFGLTVLAIGSCLVVVGMIVLGGEVAQTENRLGVTFYTLTLISAAIVGWIIATRRPKNPLGWILLAFATESAVASVAQQYAVYGHAGRWALARPDVAAVVASMADVADPVLLTLLLAMFPDGQFKSRRWRLLLVSLALVAVTGAVGRVIGPDGFDFIAGLSHPFVSNGLAGQVGRVCRGISDGLVFPTFLMGAASLLLRWRGSRGDVRQQLKWLAAACVFMMAIGASSALFPLLGVDEAIVGEVSFVIFTLGVLAFPVSIGIAVMKYRLYDIDRIVNRAVVYSIVTALLAGAYAGAVVVLQTILAPLTNGSSFAIAGSTLTAAALAGPLRNRIQEQVNRRFYRKSYDAGLTVERFAARLRSETDLETLTSDLVSVVQSTVEPASVTLWLRRIGATP